jgi:hypothetical protein
MNSASRWGCQASHFFMSSQRSGWRERLHANPSRMGDAQGSRLGPQILCPPCMRFHVHIPSVTLTGQQVRSRGEKIIANYLTYHGVSYYYEAQAMTNDWFIFKRQISRLDFFLPQYNLFVEYWGLVDSPRSEDPKRLRENHALEDGPISQEKHQIRLDISIRHAQH